MLRILVYTTLIFIGWYYAPQITRSVNSFFIVTEGEDKKVESCEPSNDSKPIGTIPQPITEKYTRSI